MKRIVAAVTGLIVALPAVPATAMGQPEPDAPAQVQKAEKIVPAKMDPADPMSISVIQEQPARAGGFGRVRVPLMRRAASGPAVRDVRAQVSVFKGGRVVDATGKGWRCRVSGGEAACRKTNLGRQQGPAPIYATFRAKKSWKKSSIQLRARAKWRGGPTAYSKAERWMVRGAGRVSVSPPLRVKLSSSVGRRIALATNSKVVNRQFILMSRIGNIDGNKVTARWRQTGGPRVKMLQPKRVLNAQTRVAQTIQIPAKMRKNAKLRFRLRVAANGQVITRNLTVRVVVHRQAGKSDGRRGQFAKLAKAVNEQGPSVGYRSLAGNGVSLQSKKWLVRPGKSTTVRVKTSRKISSMQWFIDGRPQTTGRSIEVRAPGIPWRSTLVAAVITLRNGTVLQESGQVTAKGRRIADPTTASPENIAAICKLAQDTKGTGRTDVKLPGGVNLELVNPDTKPSKDFFDKDDKCTGKGSLEFSNGVLTHPSAKLTDVTGTFTAEDGLRISGAKWTLPKKLPMGVESVSLAAGDNPAGARIVKGEWQLMTGELKLKPLDAVVTKIDLLALIPLVGGWHVADGQTLMTFLNADPQDELLKDGTVQLSEKIVGPDDMSIQVTAASSNGSWDFLGITASNIGLGKTSNGDTLMAAGTGRLALGQSGSSVDLEIQCVRDGQPVADCEVLDGFFIKDFKVTISAQRVGVLGEAGIRYGDPAELFEFGVVGAYTSPQEWTMAAKSSSPWKLGDDLELTDLAGNIGRRPAGGEKSSLDAGFTGTLTGLSFADNVKVDKLSPSITNTCQPDDPKCKAGEIRFGIDADVTVTLPGGSSRKVNAGTVLNLTTFEFGIDFGLTDVSIGPKDLHVTGSRFSLSNAPSGNCTPHGTSAVQAAPNVLYVGITAQAEIFDGVVTVGGNFDGSGYCLWGRPGAMDLGNGMQAKQGVLSYTDYPNGADLRLPGEQPALVGADMVRVNGQFELPQQIDTAFGIPAGGLRYEATFDFLKKGTQFALSYTPTAPVVIYRGTGAALNLEQVGFSVTYSQADPTVKLSLWAKGNLHIDGGGGLKNSDTGLGVSINFGFGKDGVSLGLQAGVETKGKPVVNAFGQDGLIVRELSVAASFQLPGTPTLALNSDVTLPDTWGSSIGIKNSAPIKLAFKLGASEPCVAIEIGDPDTKKPSKIAVDIADKGFLTATYFRLVIAPKGCTIPVGGGDTKRIEPGYGFDFHGLLLGVQLDVVLDVSLAAGMKIKGSLEMKALDLYVVKLQGSEQGRPLTIDLDIDTSAQRYKVAFDAGVEFGVPDRGIGARVAIKGNLNPDNPEYIDLNLTGKATARMAVIGMDIDPLNLTVHISKNDKPSYASADVRMAVHALGVSLVAGGQLTYDQGRLEKLRIYASQKLDIKIASISGTIEFDYCLGVLTDLGQNGSDCRVFSNVADALPAYRVGFYGSYQFLWWTKPYVWTVYDQKGTNGSDPPKPVLDPQTVPGAIPTLIPHTASPVALVNGGYDLKWNIGKGVFLKTMYPKDVGGAKACPRAKLGSEWTPSPATPNPDPKSVNPYDAGDCGLVVDIEVTPNEGLNPTQRTEVLCKPTFCTAQGGPYAGKVLAADGPGGSAAQEGRDALIAGLRTPLGVLPGGSFMVKSPTQTVNSPQLESPDGRFHLLTSGKNFFLWNTDTRRDKNGKLEPWTTWLSDDQPGAGTATRWRLGNDGKLEGNDQSGKALWSVGTAAQGDTSKNGVFLFINDGMTIYQDQDSGNPKAIWGVTSMGDCFPAGAKCDGKPYW